MRLLLRPLAPLVCFSTLLTAITFVATTFPVPLSRFQFLLEVLSPRIIAILILMWMQEDARRRKATPCFDFGWLSGIYFPLSLIWYCLTTRKWGAIGWLLWFSLLLSMPMLAFELARGI